MKVNIFFIIIRKKNKDKKITNNKSTIHLKKTYVSSVSHNTLEL